MKLLFLFLLVAATAAGAPIMGLFSCESNTSRFVATGGLKADFGGDSYCPIFTTPTRLYLGMHGRFGAGYINDYFMWSIGLFPGEVSSLNAIFDLDPLGDLAVGYFSVVRVVTYDPPTFEQAFRLDVVGTYTRLPTSHAGATNIAFLFNSNIPETGTAALMILGLAAVAVWRHCARPHQVTRL